MTEYPLLPFSTEVGDKCLSNVLEEAGFGNPHRFAEASW
jgi:hypothetical protein